MLVVRTFWKRKMAAATAPQSVRYVKPELRESNSTSHGTFWTEISSKNRKTLKKLFFNSKYKTNRRPNKKRTGPRNRFILYLALHLWRLKFLWKYPVTDTFISYQLESVPVSKTTHAPHSSRARKENAPPPRKLFIIFTQDRRRAWVKTTIYLLLEAASCQPDERGWLKPCFHNSFTAKTHLMKQLNNARCFYSFSRNVINLLCVFTFAS